MVMMTIDRAVVEQTLEAMDDMASDSRLLSMSPTRIRMFDSARDALRAALEQQKVTPSGMVDIVNV